MKSNQVKTKETLENTENINPKVIYDMWLKNPPNQAFIFRNPSILARLAPTPFPFKFLFDVQRPMPFATDPYARFLHPFSNTSQAQVSKISPGAIHNTHPSTFVHLIYLKTLEIGRRDQMLVP